MKIIHALTKKHMLQNKKRSIVTILGIIISVAMFTAVTTFGTSLLKMLQNESIEEYGDWQVGYYDINEEQATDLENYDNHKKVYPIYQIETMAIKPDDDNFNQATAVTLQSMNAETFKDLINLVDGRYPENDQEVILSEYTAHYDKVEIGDTVTFNTDYGNWNFDADEISPSTDSQEVQYTVVGFCKDNYSLSQMSYNAMYTLTSAETSTQAEALAAYVSLDSISNALYNDSDEIKTELGMSNATVIYNYGLSFYGVSQDDTFVFVLYTMGLIIMSIIMIGSIMLIYNAFAISLSERKRHLGMIASIGATKNQKRASVFYEGFILGIFSIPLGAILGIGGMGLAFIVINPILQDIAEIPGFPLTVSIPGVLLAVAFAVLTIFISTYLPARRASKISPMEAMRSTDDIKVAKKDVKTGRLTKLLFGFEGELALKNLKRNKKRYYVTVISLVVSVILFLSVSGFTYYLQESFALTQQESNYDAYVYSYDDQTLPSEYKMVKNATTIAKVDTMYISSLFGEERFIDNLAEEADIIPTIEEGKSYLQLGIIVSIYEDDFLESYYNEKGIAAGSILFNKSNKYYIDNVYSDKTIFKDISSDSLTFSYYDTSTAENASINSATFNNIVYTNDFPIGSSQPGDASYLTAAMSRSTYETLFPNIDIEQQQVYYTSDNPDALDEEIIEIQDEYGRNGYYNISAEAKQAEQMVFILQVFAYGFIGLISLISIANIFNTITTSVSLRTKEFAMLKSVGMTPKAFNKMIHFESLFYGFHTLLFALPLSIGILYIMHSVLNSVFSTPFTIPIMSFVIAIAAVFLIVVTTLAFSASKIKKQNIIDGLRTDSI